MKFSHLIDLHNKNENFFASNECKKIIIEQSKEIANSFMQTWLFDAAIGLWFPYYDIYVDQSESWSQDAIKKYLDEFKQNNFSLSFWSKMQNWACSSCKKISSIQENPKIICGKCTDTYLKPRTLMESFPDIDILLIHNSKVEIENILMESENVIFEQWCYTTDTHFLDKLRLINNFFDTNNWSLPLDLYIMSREQFKQWTSNLHIIESKSKYTTPTYSYHHDREIHHLPILFDTIFSSKLLNYQNDFNLEYSNIRKDIRKKYSFNDIINYINNTSYRWSLLLKENSILENLKNRYNNL